MHNPRQNGFTLLELSLTLSALLLLWQIALPMMTNWLDQIQADNQLRTLFTLANYSRQLAINHQKSVILCPSNDKKHCQTQWQQALMLFIDDNQNQQREVNEPLIQYTAPTNTLTRRLWRASAGRHYLHYQADGSTAGQNGSFYLCTPQGAIRRLIIYRTGRARIARKSEVKEKVCQF